MGLRESKKTPPPPPTAEERKKLRKVFRLKCRDDRYDGFLSFMISQHPRIGEASPAQLLGPFVMKEIFDIIWPFPGFTVVDRKFIPGDHYTIHDAGHTANQTTDCINIITAMDPALEPGTRTFWDVRVNALSTSGSMRYIGVHTDNKGFWSPCWSVNVQTSCLLHDRKEVPDRIKLNAKDGDHIGVMVDLTVNEATEGTIAFFFRNGDEGPWIRVGEGPFEFDHIPANGTGNGLWLAVTLQRERDSVTAQDGTL